MKTDSKGKIILELFLTFLKIGAFTFGGGYAMVAVIENEIVERKKWLEKDELLDIIAVAESTPGPIAINSATFIGYRKAKFWGSFCATLGVVIPSFVIITIVALFLRRFYEYPVVQDAFRGIRIGVVVLIANAVYSLAKGLKWGVFAIISALAAFILVAFLDFAVIPIILAAALAGILYSTLLRKNEAKRATGREGKS